MVTNIHAAVVLIVFAGGPHTEPRVVLAERTAHALHPAEIHLTGAEFLAEARPLVDRTERMAAADPAHPKVIVDAHRTTLSSCLALRAAIDRAFPDGASVVAVTSDYHAPRLRWLFRPLLSRHHTLAVVTSPDMPWSTCLSSPLNRQLTFGELVSWLYCFPIGLCLRPMLTACLLLAVLAAVIARRRRRAPRL